MKLLNRQNERRIANAVIADPEEHTVMDRSGAVRSIQAANVEMPEDELLALWKPVNLERLARTYWKYLSRVTLGIIRVTYTPEERAVVVIGRPLVLLRFHAPDYSMDGERGIVRWRILDGLLVASEGREGNGYLEIYCTGLGPTRNSRGLQITTVTPTVYFGSTPATPSFAGLAPGFDGLNQINVRVPDGLPSGTLPLIVTSGSAYSNETKILVK